MRKRDALVQTRASQALTFNQAFKYIFGGDVGLRADE
jgi:hypothetical protein